MATAQTTWTMVDNQGYTVPAGATVGYQVLGNQLYQFQTVSSFTVPAGSLQTAPGAVLIQATAVGSLYNGLAAADYPNLVLVNPSYAFVASISPTTTTSGGADPETTTQYLNRLSDQLQLLAPRPILPPDFAAMAQSVDGVYRATAFGGVDPFGNILSVPDGTFTPNIGTWSAVSGTATLSDSTGTLSGLDALHASVTTTTLLETVGYAVAGDTAYVAILQMDEASAGEKIVLTVNRHDDNYEHILGAVHHPVERLYRQTSAADYRHQQRRVAQHCWGGRKCHSTDDHQPSARLVYAAGQQDRGQRGLHLEHSVSACLDTICYWRLGGAVG